MAKFKVGDKVEHFIKGEGTITEVKSAKCPYPVIAKFERYQDGLMVTFTEDGRFNKTEPPTLRLTGRPFNVGDRVVVGGEKGVIDRVFDAGKTPVRADFSVENIWITTDGRAWPGTTIICEHDWEEESHDSDAIEYRERSKGVDISPGFAKYWPIDNGIEDATVSRAEVRHIAEMQEKALTGQVEIDFLKEQHKYTSMALSLTGFKVDNEAAALITETVKKVLELGGEFSLDTAREVEARVNQMYDEKA